VSFEGDFRAVLLSLAGGRVYPDVPPDTQQYPLLTYQQIGGRALWFLGKTMPDHKHARIQLNVWSKTRQEANDIARQAEALIITSAFVSEPIGAITALYESALKLYGTRQDFGIWYPDP
jgi:hypothetical protein